MTLTSIGWNDFFERAFAAFRVAELIPARVALQHRNYYVLYSTLGELRGEPTGKMQYMASGPQDLPAVGDWVVIDPRPYEQAATIVDVLPRKTKFSRQAAGRKTEEQIVAANIDSVFIVSGLDNDFNLRRIERYLVLAIESGASPVVLLNKVDLCEDPEGARTETTSLNPHVPVHVLSALKNEGVDVIRNYLRNGATGALLGSSGVGKTTIINRLLGTDERKTAPVREADDRGRHTTAARELILLPAGGLLIDTPGMRELQLWSSSDAVSEVFEDIEVLAENCKFRDCSHEVEPGCAVKEALEQGVLDEGRYESYRKLHRELQYQQRKYDPAEQRKEKERWKKIMTEYKKNKKKRGKS
ncbi:MAG: ribosome small subunit-dependent GTPase A [Ignavibacteriales bacterium]|nr:ribosome small subunit-dependent GTPase A [Ignavibacteriales bacterium]